MSENNGHRNIIISFIGFLIFISVFGGIIALIHRLLRDNSIDSPYTIVILIAITIFIYYKAWKWICRKIDLFASKKGTH